MKTLLFCDIDYNNMYIFKTLFFFVQLWGLEGVSAIKALITVFYAYKHTVKSNLSNV